MQADAQTKADTRFPDDAVERMCTASIGYLRTADVDGVLDWSSIDEDDRAILRDYMRHALAALTANDLAAALAARAAEPGAQWPNNICSGDIHYTRSSLSFGFSLADNQHGIPTLGKVSPVPTVCGQEVHIFNYPEETEAVARQLVVRWNAHAPLLAAVKYADECFEAAISEGWIEAIENGDVGSIRELWGRRLSWARNEFPTALAKAEIAA